MTDAAQRVLAHLQTRGASFAQELSTACALSDAECREALGELVAEGLIASDGFAAVAEIMLRGMLAGYHVRELPMRLGRRRFGESKLKVGDAVVAHARLLLLTVGLLATQRTIS